MSSHVPPPEQPMAEEEEGVGQLTTQLEATLTVSGTPDRGYRGFQPVLRTDGIHTGERKNAHNQSLFSAIEATIAEKDEAVAKVEAEKDEAVAQRDEARAIAAAATEELKQRDLDAIESEKERARLQERCEKLLAAGTSNAAASATRDLRTSSANH